MWVGDCWAVIFSVPGIKFAYTKYQIDPFCWLPLLSKVLICDLKSAGRYGRIQIHVLSQGCFEILRWITKQKFSYLNTCTIAPYKEGKRRLLDKSTFHFFSSILILFLHTNSCCGCYKECLPNRGSFSSLLQI